MQRDYWHDSACRHPDMDSPETIGQTAACRTLRRLAAAASRQAATPSSSIPPFRAVALSDTSSAHSPAARSTGQQFPDRQHRQKSCPISSTRAKNRTLRSFRSSYLMQRLPPHRICDPKRHCRSAISSAVTALATGMQTTGNRCMARTTCI